ncbi:hypothetical protein CDAR_495741 [Caerostris darwini]|uniref:Uncharacterized protein n=1 Tax=Caerostris darwini TaxID=1538125 RepID=A0AAV4T8F1_9ARAC|nr:hypothetical protein CDAR_495741 [Caerostris darwini]
MLRGHCRDKSLSNGFIIRKSEYCQLDERLVTCIGFPINKISIISNGIITCCGINYPDSVQRALSNSFHPVINSLLNERIRLREDSACLQIGNGWQQNGSKLISKHSNKPLDGVELLKD